MMFPLDRMRTNAIVVSSMQFDYAFRIRYAPHKEPIKQLYCTCDIHLECVVDTQSN